MGGMLGIGNSVKRQAEAGFSTAAQGETERNRVNDQIKQGEKSQRKATLGTVAGMGAQYGVKAALAAEAAGTAATVAGTTATTAGLTGAGASMVAPTGMAAALSGGAAVAPAASLATGAAGGAVAAGSGAAATGALALGPVGWSVAGGLILASLF